MIVWSDKVTRFFGRISARGGAASGDGGFAEVSGKQRLQFAPVAIDLSAPNGALGELLLDPQDIVISDNDEGDADTTPGTDNSKISSTDSVINFGDDSGTDYEIQPSAFETIDADITLQATRDITVKSAIDLTGQTQARTLTLQAGRHLVINANITGNSTHGHNFIFEADSPRSTSGGADGTGTLTIGDGVTITSNNGDITLIGADFEISTTSGSEASLDAGTGDIHIAPSQTTAALTIGSGATDVLSNAELGRLTASGTIVLGTATTGPTGSGGAGSSISAASITVSQALSIGGSASLEFDSAGATTLGANVSTADGSITFSDAVTLSAGVTVDSDSDSDTTDGDISFSSMVDGAQTLTVDADTGSVTLSGAVGEFDGADQPGGDGRRRDQLGRERDDRQRQHRLQQRGDADGQRGADGEQRFGRRQYRFRRRGFRAAFSDGECRHRLGDAERSDTERFDERPFGERQRRDHA